MTDLPLSPDDEIVSAVLDGVATDDERARVHHDPTLSARLAELGRVRDAVAAPVRPLDEVTARRLLDRALATSAPTAPTTTASPPVRDVRRHRVGFKVVGIAAAVLVALLAVPLFGSLAGNDADEGEQTATMDAPAETGLDDSADSAEAAPAAGLDGTEEFGRPDDPTSDGEYDESVPDPNDLGSLPDLDALVDEAERAAARTSDPSPESLETSPGASLCESPSAGDEVLLEAYATVDGDILFVRVWSTAGGSVVVQVIDPVTCDVIEERRV